MVISSSRDSLSHIRLLDQMVGEFPSDRWLVIENYLSTHSSGKTMLALAGRLEVPLQFIPRYACWLYLIEPWWIIFHKDRRFHILHCNGGGLCAYSHTNDVNEASKCILPS